MRYHVTCYANTRSCHLPPLYKVSPPVTSLIQRTSKWMVPTRRRTNKNKREGEGKIEKKESIWAILKCSPENLLNNKKKMCPEHATQQQNSTKMSDKKKTVMSIDAVLQQIGDFGLHQKLVDASFCLIFLLLSFPVLIMFFSTLTPRWECTDYTFCPYNTTQPSENTLRCSLPAGSWR